MCKSLQRWDPALAEKADSSGRTALHYAASFGKLGVVKLLLVNSLLAYIPDDDGLYPVHYAAMAGYSIIIREIMEICPSCDELVDKKHRSILHCAVEFGRATVVWYICVNPKFMSIMNAGDSEGNTPLHLAVKHGHVLSVILLMMDIRVNLGIINHKGFTPLGVAWNENAHKYSFSVFMDIYMEVSFFCCEAYSIPSDLVGNQRYNHCLEDNKKSSRFSKVSQTMLCLSVLIAAASFAAAFTPPGNEKAGMAPLDGESYLQSYVEANTLSFYHSAIATCLLIHASLATIPIRYRSNYLRVSAVMVLTAVVCMFEAFTSVVRLSLDPQKSFFFFCALLVQRAEYFLLCLLLIIPVCLRVLRKIKHPRPDMPFKVLAALASFLRIGVALYMISFVTRVQPGKQESCSGPECHDGVLLHPT